MKTSFSRRRFVLVGSQACIWNALPQVGFAQPADSESVPPAPKARIEAVQDTYFGETLSDPYRWMENNKDHDWLPFMQGQNAHARAILDRLSTRADLYKRIQRMSGDMASTTEIQRAGGSVFYAQRPKGATNFKLFVRERSGRVRTLVDPTAQNDAQGHTALDWWRVSPNGRYVVYGLSKNGSENSLLYVISVASGKHLSDQVPNTENADPSWLDDETGFFYTQLTGEVGSPERYLDSVVRFHRIGTETSNDPIIMKRGLLPSLSYERIQMPRVQVMQGSRYAILTLRDVRPEFRGFVARLAEVIDGTPAWQEFISFNDEVTDLNLLGDDLYLVVNKNAPRGKLVLTSIRKPDIGRAKVIVEQVSAVIDGIDRAGDGLYLRMSDGGIAKLKKLGDDGQLTEIKLNFDSTIVAFAADPKENGAVITLSTWLKPTVVYFLDDRGVLRDSGINPAVQVDVSGYEAKRFFASAQDGTKIPYTLIYKKGLKRDGTAPTLMSAYGSYGAAVYTPNFVGRLLAFIDRGGIIGYAGVRGGGEYGRQWHRAGQLDKKANTWRDLIAVCESLNADRWTSTAHLAIGGRSAGGIAVGRAMTERPDLFAAVIDGVGWSNPLRYVVEQDGYTEEPEWGAINDPQGYKALRSIDSYQAVKDGVSYPAVLLTTGLTDPRVAPFHAAKMAARIQAATTSRRPVLLRVDFDAGHGVGSTRSQQDQELADTFAFLLWQLKGEK